jgi:hypothetical protein
MTMTEATEKPLSSLKKTLVERGFCPLAVYLISMELSPVKSAGPSPAGIKNWEKA